MPQINVHINAHEHALDQEIIPFEIKADATLGDLRQIVGDGLGFPLIQQQFLFEGRPLTDDSVTLTASNIKDGDMLAVIVGPQQDSQQRVQQSSQGLAGQVDPRIESLRQMLLIDATKLNNMSQSMPGLREVVNDPIKFQELVVQTSQQQSRNESRNDSELLELQRRAEADPFDIEIQKKIEELIRKKNVDENMEFAHEHMPELFTSVTMLYIYASVNGHQIKVLVDSGAQATIMSPSCAEACNIMRLIDTRFAGIARGVGTAKILGRVHSANLQIGNDFLPCSFTVMEGKAVDMLLGLDMLKRYQAIIDLKRNKLVFEHAEVDFLAESEIPKWVVEEQAAENTIPGPVGTEIGTDSGVIRPAGTTPHMNKKTTTESQSKTQGESSQASQSNSTPSVQAPNSTSNTSNTTTSARVFPKESIDQLMSIGFDRNQAIAALEATDGNVEYAAGLLFQN